MFSRRFKSFAIVVVVATAVALSVRLFVIESFRVISHSMVPTLNDGDIVFVSKMAYNMRVPFSTYELLRTGKPKANEVVAFSLPDKGGETFIKRVVGVEGDQVQIRGGKVFINDKEVQTFGKGPIAGEYGPVDVPTGHFFAMGDNSGDSTDSRTWGPIPDSCLKGRVALVWFSIDDSGGLRSDRIGLRVK